MTGKAFGVYLNDHLAGPAFAISAAGFCAEHTSDPALETFLRTFQLQLLEERDVLEQVLRSLGFSPKLWKRAAVFVGERASRLKFLEVLGGYTSLSEFEQLESLRLGVQGKRGLWSLLARLADAEPALKAFPLARFVERSDAQIASLERFRVEAGERVARAA